MNRDGSGWRESVTGIKEEGDKKEGGILRCQEGSYLSSL